MSRLHDNPATPDPQCADILKVLGPELFLEKLALAVEELFEALSLVVFKSELTKLITKSMERRGSRKRETEVIY